MTNEAKAIRTFVFNPFHILYSVTPVDYVGVTGDMQYGPVWLLEVAGKWYSLSEWLRCEEGKVPEEHYKRGLDGNWQRRHTEN